MNWITYEQLATETVALAHRLPRDLVGVLGIPRSGMLPAAIIAAELGVRLGDAYTFAETGRFSRSGPRMSWPLPDEGPVLLVDDSLYAGQAMARAFEALDASPYRPQEVLRAATYLAPDGEERVDFFSRIVEMPRLFAWNWLGHPSLGAVFFDMDGLICTDPDVFDDDGPIYAESLRSATSRHLPRRKVGAIVTGRLERWRTVTERWLVRHGIQYERLIMAPFATAAERRAYGAPRWKGEVCCEHAPVCFLESDPREAPLIAEHAGCPVICPATGEVWR